VRLALTAPVQLPVLVLVLVLVPVRVLVRTARLAVLPAAVGAGGQRTRRR
jgi:hypothetical protein